MSNAFEQLPRVKSLITRWRSVLWRYPAALVAVGAALWLESALDPWLGLDLPMVILFPALVLIAWRLGIGPALFGLAISGVTAAWFDFQPLNSLSIDQPRHVIALLLFLSVGLMLVGLVHVQQAAQQRALNNAIALQQSLAREQHKHTDLEALLEARKRAEELLAQHQDQLEETIHQRTEQLEQSHQRLRSTERMAAVGTLAAGVGHDMGNLVLPILCRLDALLDQVLPEAALQELRLLRTSTGKLRELSAGLRMFASDPGESVGSVHSTTIESWWRVVEPLMRRSLPGAIVLQADLQPDLPQVAIAPQELTQATLNLIANAGESLNGEGLVRVWANAAPDRRSVALGVSDNGRGMSPEVLRHALEPFFTTKTRTISTGMGLPQVNCICQSVGGTLAIDSSPGHGTTVVLTLPAFQLAQQYGLPRLAHVGLQDQRVASYATALLKYSGFHVPESGPVGSPEESLWITEPSVHALEEIRQFVRERPGRRVIVVGQSPEEWNEPGIIMVDGSHRAMRKALQAASTEMSSV